MNAVMTRAFQPDYRHVVAAARNQAAARVPLYEHLVDLPVIEQVSGHALAGLLEGSDADAREFCRHYAGFFHSLGYDTVSFEYCVTAVLPGGGALLSESHPPAIRDRADFEAYPWAELPAIFAAAADRAFDALGAVLPAGMKAVGGPGNGVFECVQDLTGFVNLCYLSVDDPELYADLFRAMGDAHAAIWRHFLDRHADTYAVCRFGDDLGYKTGTLLPPDDVRRHVVPQYARLVDLVHAAGKPFLLHSCGQTFDVMDDIIERAKIDAKHSNEDVIAPFGTWVERYGDRIGNFGGLDVDFVCRAGAVELRAAATELVTRYGRGHGGVALGTGNSIAHYVPVDSYLTMVEAYRVARGE
jgi:uroporphyrinogen decarboxylase